jgi:hypothetical protein
VVCAGKRLVGARDFCVGAGRQFRRLANRHPLGMVLT